jgi:hypothetical protein
LQVLKIYLIPVYKYLSANEKHLHSTVIYLDISIFRYNAFRASVTDTTKESLDIIFTKEEVNPSFKGGNEALNKYLKENVRQVMEKRELFILLFLPKEIFTRLKVWLATLALKNH